MSLSGHLLKALVIRHDPEKGGMYLLLGSGQLLNFPVTRLYDMADGLRIKKPPLPVQGSWGLLACPGGDLRNATWMGAYHPNLVDSLPDLTDDPFSDYESNYDGSWAYTHGVSGFHGRQFADNSSFVMSSGSLNVPTLYRHIVTSGQAQQRVVFDQNIRNPHPQKPFGWKYTQATSGQIGGTTFALDVSGNFSLNDGGVTGKTHNVTFNECSLTIDASGNFHVDLPAGKILYITQGGAAASDFLTLVSKLVSAYNSHTHGGVQTGGSSTAVPDQQWTAATVESTAIKISN